MTITSPTVAASTRWNDYLGTIAADDAAVLAGGASLYELIGLDRDHWIVVGADLEMKAEVAELVIFAGDRGPARRGMDDLLDANGQIPVTAFTVSDPRQIERFFTEAFGQLVNSPPAA